MQSPERIEAYVDAEDAMPHMPSAAQIGFLTEPARTGRLADFVTSRNFDLIVTCVVVANLLHTCYEVDYKFHHRSLSGNLAMQIVDFCFLGLYAIEVLLRIAVHRLHFFINDDRYWNIFDLVLVLSGFSFILGTKLDADFLRTLRLLRVANKIVRVVKVVHFVSELRLMIQCVLGSLRSLVWALVLLTGFTVVFSLLLVQQFTNSIIKGSSNEPYTQAELEMIDASFSSVYKAMISLFKSISGGADWGAYYDLANNTGQIGATVFLLYILVSWLSITNIITSIFVDHAMKLAQPDANDRALEKRKSDIKVMHELSEIFKSIDIDHSDTISFDELRACLNDVKIASYLDMVGLSISDAETFYFLLTSSTGNTEIDLSSLVSGWLREPWNGIEV